MQCNLDTPQFLLYTTLSIRSAPVSLPRLRADGDLVLHSTSEISDLMPHPSGLGRYRPSPWPTRLDGITTSYSTSLEPLHQPRPRYHTIDFFSPSTLTSRTRPRTTQPECMSTLGCSRTHSPPCSPQNPGRNTIPNSLLVPIPRRHGANWPLSSLEDFEISDGSGHMNADVVDGIPLRKRIWKSVCTHSLFKLFRGYVGRV